MRNQTASVPKSETYGYKPGRFLPRVPASSVVSLAARLGISTTALCGYLHISTKTVQRKGDNNLSFLVADKLVTIERVMNRAVQVIGSEAGAVSWLKTPVSALGNSVPIAYLETTSGTQIVMDLLGQIEWGLIS